MGNGSLFVAYMNQTEYILREPKRDLIRHEKETMKRPSTLGELKDSGYQVRTVKDEMRGNLI